jgi:hypothetical protein
MRFDNAFCDGEPEADAAAIAGAIGPEAVEHHR